MKKIVETSIKKGVVPAHAPSWAKMTDVQWIEKLDDMVKNPNKYKDSPLKQILTNACK